MRQLTPGRVRFGSSTEMLRLSIIGLLFLKKADAGAEVGSLRHHAAARHLYFRVVAHQKCAAYTEKWVKVIRTTYIKL